MASATQHAEWCTFTTERQNSCIHHINNLRKGLGWVVIWGKRCGRSVCMYPLRLRPPPHHPPPKNVLSDWGLDLVLYSLLLSCRWCNRTIHETELHIFYPSSINTHACSKIQCASLFPEASSFKNWGGCGWVVSVCAHTQLPHKCVHAWKKRKRNIYIVYKRDLYLPPSISTSVQDNCSGETRKSFM